MDTIVVATSLSTFPSVGEEDFFALFAPVTAHFNFNEGSLNVLLVHLVNSVDLDGGQLLGL
jgi:hypothetical protein